jgi:Protein of unknown function (DUF1203)
MSDYRVHPIDPTRIAAMRSAGCDEHGNPFTAFAAAGWEPLRCCLRLAERDEQIALISYAPFQHRSPWTEVGPVYVHADACGGYAGDGLPTQLRTGPRILRTYRGDGTLDYAHVTLVPEGEDLEPALHKVLAEPEVATVHVRALLTQCFTYAVESVRPAP